MFTVRLYVNLNSFLPETETENSNLKSLTILFVQLFITPIIRFLAKEKARDILLRNILLPFLHILLIWVQCNPTILPISLRDSQQSEKGGTLITDLEGVFRTLFRSTISIYCFVK